MPPLSPGAVELPMHHVSVRVPWHDTDWTGRVCASPSTNHACTVLKNVKDKKDPLGEEAEAGLAWTDVDVLPPCVAERAGFMRTKTFMHAREHPYAWKKRGGHAHFARTLQRMPAHSLEVTPFRWVMVDENERYVEPWGIELDDALEKRAQELMGHFDDTWIQDKRNQLALIDSFFSALRPRRSLVLLYAKDIPLVEDREAGERYLLGAGFVEGVDPVVEWEYSEPGELRSVMWERGVAHSIRPSFEDGFLLPYRELLSNPSLQGLDLEPFIARAPAEHFDEFSYVSELVSHDGAISGLTELARVVDLLPGVVEGPWDHVSTWIADRLTDAWQARGPYPGMGPLLTAAGVDRGALLARRVLDELPEGTVDPWPELERAVTDNRGGLVGRTGRKAWERLSADEARYRQLRVMSRFALTGGQARELFDGLPPAPVIENPYCLYEHGAGTDLAFTTIDRGLWPQDADSRNALAADPIDEPVTESSDDRRVRAASIHVLDRAAEQGHTLLDEAGLRKGLARLKIEPRCDPGNAAFEIAADEFDPLIVERELARDAGRGWQLDRLANVTDVIRGEVRSRLEGPPLDVAGWVWADRITKVLPAIDAPDVAELEARAEKAAALEVIVRSCISALVGPAGTGKTSMLEALCADAQVDANGILLIAPTGKAAVQLASRTGKPAKTLAQFLFKHGRWDIDGGYYLAPKEARFQGAKTVVIDEASMLTEEMLAATIDALAGVDRLVLCGDPRQLPPIGAGRPFADLVAFLRTEPGPGGGVAELRTGRRQAQVGVERDTTPDDVAVASLFSMDAETLGADEALARVLSGHGDGRVEIASWSDEEDLHSKIVEMLGAESSLGLDGRTRGAICRSFGAECDDEGLPQFPRGEAGAGAERWQILSPVRARSGGVDGLNELVRRTWRGTDVRMALRSRKMTSPMGADQVIFADKVMIRRNDHRRKAKVPETWEEVTPGVANGEIGLVVHRVTQNKRPAGHVLELSTRPNLQFAFWDNELNADSESHGEWLELAYAVTVHKSQGSQFKTTFVVIPDPCPLLSPELLYTALTRQQDKVVLLKQGDLGNLREFASPSRSQTARRLTCLFRPADPFALGDGTVVDAGHVHRTARGDDLVRSKSEVIVADALHDLGLDYRYEAPLAFPEQLPRHPDFTISRSGASPVYWEHLGMLNLAGYRADWQARKAWYASHDILPWEDGGGSGGVLVTSDENVGASGIDSHGVRELAQKVFAVGLAEAPQLHGDAPRSRSRTSPTACDGTAR